jgi:hypothetical protein
MFIVCKVDIPQIGIIYDRLWGFHPEVTSPKEWMVLGCSGGEPERGSQEEGAAFLEEVTGSLGLKTVAVKR